LYLIFISIHIANPGATVYGKVGLASMSIYRHGCGLKIARLVNNIKGDHYAPHCGSKIDK
jgi:hypothetical protein